MVEVVIQLPETLASLFGETDEARSRRLLEDAVALGYQAGNLSHAQVGELLGLGFSDTEKFLSDRGIPADYTLADLEADRRTLDELFSKR
jgi:predicted HTH domain antitoxin